MNRITLVCAREGRGAAHLSYDRKSIKGSTPMRTHSHIDADADEDLGGRTGVLEEVTVMDVVEKICRVR